jgi:hypothetical protein
MGAIFRFQLRSLPLRLAAISGRFSSSLLPPSFARGRFATFFSLPDPPTPFVPRSGVALAGQPEGSDAD